MSLVHTNNRTPNQCNAVIWLHVVEISQQCGERLLLFLLPIVSFFLSFSVLLIIWHVNVSSIEQGGYVPRSVWFHRIIIFFKHIYIHCVDFINIEQFCRYAWSLNWRIRTCAFVPVEYCRNKSEQINTINELFIHEKFERRKNCWCCCCCCSVCTQCGFCFFRRWCCLDVWYVQAIAIRIYQFDCLLVYNLSK